MPPLKMHAKLPGMSKSTSGGGSRCSRMLQQPSKDDNRVDVACVVDVGGLMALLWFSVRFFQFVDILEELLI